MTLLLHGKSCVETKFNTLVVNLKSCQWRIYDIIFTHHLWILWDIQLTQERPYCIRPLVISRIVYLLTLSLRDGHIYFGIISSESIAFGPSVVCLDIDSVFFCL